MAYGVYVCDKFLPPIPVGDDPVGIHTHGDGLVHIHPFVESAAGKNAVMARFFETEKLTVSAKEVRMPDGTSYPAGTTCNGKKSTVRTLYWSSRKAAPTVVKDAAKLRFADQAIVVFAVAPDDAKIPMPPSVDGLSDPADLPAPSLSDAQVKALPKAVAKPKPADLHAQPPKDLELNDLVVGSGAEAKSGARPYVRYVLYIWRDQQELATSSWKDGEQPEALNRLGKGRLLPGLDRGLVGMKVGGVRQIIIPPELGFGKDGSPPVKGDDTLIFIAQLVAIAN